MAQLSVALIPGFSANSPVGCLVVYGTNLDIVLLRGGIVNKTYGINKNLYV